jgi:hypothetical protein
MGEKGHVPRFLVRKLKKSKPLEIPTPRYGGNIKMDINWGIDVAEGRVKWQAVVKKLMGLKSSVTY